MFVFHYNLRLTTLLLKRKGGRSNLDGLGHIRAYWPGEGDGLNGRYGDVLSSGSGAGHGGRGGNSTDRNRGLDYGSLEMPTELGSEGGWGTNCSGYPYLMGGPGGGRLILSVKCICHIDESINVDGIDGEADYFICPPIYDWSNGGCGWVDGESGTLYINPNWCPGDLDGD